MAVFTYTKPHHAGKLYDELVAAVPALKPVKTPDGAWVAVWQLEEQGDVVKVKVPDELGVKEAEIRAVVMAHDPTPPPPAKEQATVETVRKGLQGRAWGSLTDAERWELVRARLVEQGWLDGDGLVV